LAHFAPFRGSVRYFRVVLEKIHSLQKYNIRHMQNYPQPDVAELCRRPGEPAHGVKWPPVDVRRGTPAPLIFSDRGSIKVLGGVLFFHK
jgi:hypothetical protein